MKSTFSFLFVATVVGMAACRPGTTITVSGPHGMVTYVDGRIVETSNSVANSKNFPTRWVAEFIDLVQAPNENVIEALLGRMDNVKSWKLRSHPSQSNNQLSAWNIWMQLPRFWRVKEIPQSMSHMSGDLYATIKLNDKDAGSQYFRSRKGNFQPNSVPDQVSIDYNVPIELKYTNNRLSIEFTVKRN